MKKILIVLLAILMLVPFATSPIAVFAEAANLITSKTVLNQPNSGVGQFENGVLTANMDANEYLMLFETPGLSDTYTYSGKMLLKFIGAQDWTGIRFVIGYKDPTHFTLINVAKNGNISVISRDPDKGWNDNCGIDPVPAKFPLTKGANIDFLIVKEKQKISLTLNGTKVIEGNLNTAFDYFTTEEKLNVGIFNSKVSIVVTNLTLINGLSGSAGKEAGSTQSDSAADTSPAPSVSDSSTSESTGTSSDNGTSSPTTLNESNSEAIPDDQVPSVERNNDSVVTSTTPKNNTQTINPTSIILIILAVVVLSTGPVIYLLKKKKKE